MKKFLSLVLALIMTMSLVTISAGATEYRDLTDKDEIQYEEAVAVLNRIGVITGYEDGSFRPETELTRGAAAKIIVSLMIGPEAASALPNNASPYPDVPAGHTFAGVIGYCKTAGYISGYGDGTFKPANPLTGYAFAKMLLGAIGYKSDIEGFVDTGWTMNVARIGNVAGLFDRLDFDGAKAVTRDEACQLALNTLKATMVDYGNTNTVVSSNGQVLTVQGSKAAYVTSNNRDINANINRRVISAQNNEMTLEFGEEHFKDLRLEHDRYDPAYDIYGHPSNEWSYKKVTIGTFKLPADFTFTKQMAHIEDTTATKEKALGLRGYDTYSIDHRGGYVSWTTAASDRYATSPFADATQIHINGWEARVRNADLYKQTAVPSGETDKKGVWYSYDADSIGATTKDLAPTLSEICDLTDNGVTVEVYVCPVDADFITDVVVTRTQLMEVDRIASDYVELDTISSDSKDPYKAGDLAEIAGYNDYSLMDEVVSVKDNNYDAYNVLKDLKAGDEVAVIPYTSDNGKTWEVGRAYVPETVTGALTNVDIYNTKSKADGNAIAITVGGTTYPIAQWNKDMREIDATKIRSTKKDVTLLLDETGNALLAKDVGNSNAWIVVGDYYQGTLSSGRVGWFVHGWTIKGDEVDLELGSIRGAAEKYAPGDLVKYQVAESGDGEYELVKPMYRNGATGGQRILKNGSLSAWTEPSATGKDKDGKTVYTGEGIYNIAQFANKTVDAQTSAVQYKIEGRNTLLPLEFYNTEISGSAKTMITSSGDDVVHFDYAEAKSTPNQPVGTDADTAKAEAAYKVTNPGATSGWTVYSGELTAADTSDWYVKSGYTNKWEYLAAPYDDVKFIYVGFDSSNGNVEVFNILSGVQSVAYDELKQINRWWKNVGTNDGDWVASPAEAYVDKDGKVKAVVIKSDSAEANLKDLMIITDNRGTHTSTKAIGAEAPTSGTYNTYQYVSGEDGFKEEKTGYFDKKLNVGDVITGTLQSNGIVRAKIFHANDYTNRNPDGFYVKGIKPLETQEGEKIKTAFYIDKVNDPQYLGRGVTGGGKITKSDVDILTNFEVLGYDHDIADNYKGLIKVDSTTQFVDLRNGRPGNIEELGDLFDKAKCDSDKVELKVLVNGNKSSDGFRHAYVIMILEAQPAADNAVTPVLNIQRIDNGTVKSVDTKKDESGKEVVIGKGTEKEPWQITVAPNTVVNLRGVVTNASKLGGTLTPSWSAYATPLATDAYRATVTAPDIVGEKEAKLVSFTVVHKDASKKDVQTASATVYVKIIASNESPDPTPAGGIKVVAGPGMSNYVSNLTGSMNLMASGSNKITLSFDAPAWANGVNEDASEVSFDLVLVKNGTTDIATRTITNIAATTGASAAQVNTTNKTSTAATKYSNDALELVSTDVGLAISTGVLKVGTDSLEVQVRNVKYKYAVVDYKFEAGTDDPDTDVVVSISTGAIFQKMLVGTPGANPNLFGFKYTLPAGYTGASLTYKVEGASATTGNEAELAGSLSSGTDKDLANVYANGGEKVVVTISGITKTPTAPKIQMKNWASTKYIFGAGDVITNLTAGTTDANGDSMAVTDGGKLIITSARGTVATDAVTYAIGETGTDTFTVAFTKGAGGTDASKVKVKLVLTDKDGKQVGTALETTLEDSTSDPTKKVTWTVPASQDLFLDLRECTITPVVAPAIDKSASSYDKTTKVLTVKFDASKPGVDEDTIIDGAFVGKAGVTVTEITYVDARTVTMVIGNLADTASTFDVTANASIKGTAASGGAALTATDMQITVNTGAVA